MYMCVDVCMCSVTQSCLTLCDHVDCSPAGSSVHGKNTGVDCHSLLQGIFPSQGSNLGLPHFKQILYCLSHKGSPPWKYRELNATELGKEGRENSRSALVWHVGSAEEKTACDPGQPGLGAGALLLKLNNLRGHVHHSDSPQ